MVTLGTVDIGTTSSASSSLVSSAVNAGVTYDFVNGEYLIFRAASMISTA
jgi:hypothetical protein